MNENIFIDGFSKFSKTQRIAALHQFMLQHLENSGMSEASEMVAEKFLTSFNLPNKNMQQRVDEFSENTVANFMLPYSVVPNVLINQESYIVPMVIEESSVVAAASKAAKFWSQFGGFQTEVHATEKVGHVHFLYSGDPLKLQQFFMDHVLKLRQAVNPFLLNMENRGGGLLRIELENATQVLANYYKLVLTFNTCDAMGANLINTVLEEMAKVFKYLFTQATSASSSNSSGELEIIFSILSNYTPRCLATSRVEVALEKIPDIDGLPAAQFVRRFIMATEIARVDVGRAVTHNKGIMNGIDAVVLATGNDFRAVEACVHAYASRSGKYQSLSHATLTDDKIFKFELTVPLALGTVGGLTQLHPLAAYSLKLLKNPSAEKLMQIAATIGLAQNFAAIKSLITSGIQKGHMKMHLLNILQQLGANSEQIHNAKEFFMDKVISYKAVQDFLLQDSARKSLN